ncbi:MAG: hypothetical protein ABIF08_03100 [Nanoarchaeota archaeon]
MAFHKKIREKIPVHAVMEMSKKGIPETEIINRLRERGYGPLAVDKALREALKGAANDPISHRLERSRFPKLEKLPPVSEEEIPLPDYEDRPGVKKDLRREDDREERKIREDMPELPRLPGEPGYEEVKITKPPRKTLEEMSSDLREDIEPLERPRDRPRKENYNREHEPSEPELPREQFEGIPRERMDPMELGGPKKPVDDETKEVIEELVETVIEEKWDSVKNKMDSFEIRFEKIEKKLAAFKEDVSDMHQIKPESVEKLSERVDMHEKSVSEIGDKMQSMEDVVKSSLTPMMESLRSLSETIRELKKGKKK